jgi:hypothetical protein
VFALPAGVENGQITVINPGTKPATAGLVAYRAGDTAGPSSEPEVPLAAARFGTFDVSADAGRVLVVSSDQPVSAGLTFTGDGSGAASLTAAVPDFAFRG